MRFDFVGFATVSEEFDMTVVFDLLAFVTENHHFYSCFGILVWASLLIVA